MNTKSNTIDTKVFNRIYSRKLLTNIIFASIFSVLMAISANSFIYLPFTPVPITMQVLTVLLSAIFLGAKWAFISQVEYIIIGILGFPVFAGFKSGIQIFLGPTAGYIIGFPVAAYISGYIYENFYTLNIFSRSLENKLQKNNTLTLFISGISAVIIIYFFGYIHLAGYLFNIYRNHKLINVIIKTWELGIKPFIIVDLLKVLIVTGFFNIFKSQFFKIKNNHLN